MLSKMIYVIKNQGYF